MAQMSVDHLLFAGPNLEQLRLDLAMGGGPEAQPGGRHENWGTHNALIGLGEGTYLELIAPEPDRSGPWGDLIGKLRGPSLQAWCARCGSAAEVEALLAAAGVRSRRMPGGRRLADGSELAWELVFPTAHEFGGVLPFFIDWRRSVHPSVTLPAAASLTRLTLEHPDAAALRSVLSLVGELPPAVRLVQSPRMALKAELRGSGGKFELEGSLNAEEYLGNA